MTLKELVMWAFFPLFVFTGRNKEGGQAWRGDQPLSEGFCPSMPAAVTLGEPCTCTHTHRNAHTGLLACTHFIERERLKVGG